jgi:hypothetical protein
MKSTANPHRMVLIENRAFRPDQILNLFSAESAQMIEQGEARTISFAPHIRKLGNG